MLKMDQFFGNLEKLLQNPENYLRPNEDLYRSWVGQTALFYNDLKKEEILYGLPHPGEALPELYTDGLDLEQIWQQVELQNNTLLAAPDDLTSLNDVNLPYCVVKLNSRVKYDSLNNNIQDRDPSGIEGEDDSASEMDDEEDEKKEEEEGDDMEEDEDEDGEEDEIDMDFETKQKKPQDSLLTGDEFEDLDSSDFDEDHFDDLAPEGQEDEEEEEEEDEGEDDNDDNKEEDVNNTGCDDDDDDEDDEDEINEMKKSLTKDKNKMDNLKKPDRFKSTNVDDEFFNLRESEWVADNDILGDELEGNFGDIDFMEDITDDEEDAGAAMYSTFFDSINDNKKKSRIKKNNEEKNNQSETENQKLEKHNISKDDASKEESDDEDMDGGVTKLLGGNKKETKSTFEREQEKERQIIETLEDEQMSEKPWFLKGEVKSQDRPENSTLEEHLDYDIAAKQRPVITEDTTALVEKLILNRIRTQAFDDVERKVKPEANPFEYKKKLLLEQEKSKKSLAEIYEEEYMKKKEIAEDDEEPKEHTEIKSMMDSLFMKLDALANYHYMPKNRKAEVKIVSNLPAVTMEESTPATATDASLLAPQEVLAPVRGELIASGERTTTNKKSDRRMKKAKQRARAKEQEKKLQEKLKKAGGDGRKLDVNTSAKVVQKAVKAGQVKLLSDDQGSKHIKSSQSFFKQLQDDVSSQIKNKNPKNIEKKKKKKEISATTVSKIIL